MAKFTPLEHWDCLKDSSSLLLFLIYSVFACFPTPEKKTEICINTYISDIKNCTMVKVHVKRLNTSAFCLIFSILNNSVHWSFPVRGSTMLALWWTLSSQLVLLSKKTWGKVREKTWICINTYTSCWFQIYSQQKPFYFFSCWKSSEYQTTHPFPYSDRLYLKVNFLWILECVQSKKKILEYIVCIRLLHKKELYW